MLKVDETDDGLEEQPQVDAVRADLARLAAYHLVGSKSAATARKILTGFRGTLVVDGFIIYPIVAELEKSIRIATAGSMRIASSKMPKTHPRRSHRSVV